MSHNTTPNEQDTDAEALAAKHNISMDDAKKLIEEVGYDRGALDQAAEDLKASRR